MVARLITGSFVVLTRNQVAVKIRAVCTCRGRILDLFALYKALQARSDQSLRGAQFTHPGAPEVRPRAFIPDFGGFAL